MVAAIFRWRIALRIETRNIKVFQNDFTIFSKVSSQWPPLPPTRHAPLSQQLSWWVVYFRQRYQIFLLIFEIAICYLWKLFKKKYGSSLFSLFNMATRYIKNLEIEAKNFGKNSRNKVSKISCRNNEKDASKRDNCCLKFSANSINFGLQEVTQAAPKS